MHRSDMSSAKPSRKVPESTENIWICGINPVYEALRGWTTGLSRLLVARRSTDNRVMALEKQARELHLQVEHLDREMLSELVGHGHHQGVALRCRGFPYADEDAFLSRSVEELAPLLLLDSIQDPQNLGAVLRSGCCLGAKGVVVPKDRATAVTGAVIKVAAGAASLIPVVQVTNLVRTMEKLKDAGLWVVGLDLQGDQSLHEADLSMPIGLVVGSEHKGLRPLVREHCDLLLHIPVYGPLQSLNAATAAAIALAEIQRQRCSGTFTRQG